MPGTVNHLLEKFAAWALPPSSAGEERARAGGTLFVLSLSLMGAAFSLVQAWVYRWTGAIWTLGTGELCLIAAFWLNRRGEVEWATKIICFSELACGLVLITFFSSGFSDETLLVFPLILVVAAVLLSWRSYIAFAGLVVVSVASAGLILAATDARRANYHRVANTVNILFITAVAAGLLVHNLKRSASQSREAERRVKALSGRLIDAQEEERARIARELHDDLNQQVAGLSIAVGNLKRNIPLEQTEARSQSDRVHQKLVQLSESVRRISHELHPAILEYSGLAAALRSCCDEFGALTGIQASLDIDGSFDGVPSPAALCVYRITQEALRNVSKHAKARSAAVGLSRSDGVLRLTVSDNGMGMEPDRAEASGGLGLVSIRERTRLVGGRLEITSQPNRGTTLSVRIPV